MGLVPGGTGVNGGGGGGGGGEGNRVDKVGSGAGEFLLDKV